MIFWKLRLGILVATLGAAFWSSKALIKEGVVWRIGNGSQVKIWDNPWVVDDDGRFLSSGRNNEFTMVSDLIDFERKEWKLDLIEDNFNARDVKCIQAPL